MKTNTPKRPLQTPHRLDDPVLRENPFEVPEQYFETFSQRLDLAKDTGKSGKLIPMPRRSVKLWSVAAALLLLLGTGLLMLLTDTKRPSAPQFSDQVVLKQEPLKKKTPAPAADTAILPVKKGEPGVAAPAKTPAQTPVTPADHSLEALQQDGITDDDIIEYLMEEGFDLIDLTYQP